MAELTSAELKEAANLRKDVSTKDAAITRARKQLYAAVGAGVNQTSSRWAGLCVALENAIATHTAAVASEQAWWRAKGFNV